MGSVLVMPQSQEETEFLLNLIYYFWINCNDIEVEGSWECKDGTTDVKYRNWRAGEPGFSGIWEDCAATDKKGWNDVPCSDLSPVICERPTPRLHT
ncbi:C-type lectin domain family 4 member E-like [Acanthaster planci]|uniref:C-type lectin domain family 4 member E-like n=1 Tax=Acanthaster planci TaxID=133434 RepID=A0A8B7ZQY3_ACAPL|nr:C-type lectin domain family 4 member E-like [Acanthaster planci]